MCGVDRTSTREEEGVRRRFQLKLYPTGGLRDVIICVGVSEMDVVRDNLLAERLFGTVEDRLRITVVGKSRCGSTPNVGAISEAK